MSASDPRLMLQWYRFAPPLQGPIIITPYDAAREKSGLGVQDGVVSYRDGFGRVGQVAKNTFTAHAKALTRVEAAAVLPAMAPDVALLRFPLLAARAKILREREEAKKTQPRRSLPSKVVRSGKPKPARAPAPSPVVVVKRARKPDAS